jgi:hypothetical protein
MNKKGTIKAIEPNGLWNGLTKYKVIFADGNQYTFFAKGDFKFSKGDKITYEVTNEEYKNARIPIGEYKKEVENDTENITMDLSLKSVSVKKPLDKDIIKIKTDCIKASAIFNAKRLMSNTDDVINDAQLFFNFITK